MFFLNYIIFILLILFIHLLALTTKCLNNSKYFFGVYVNEIEMENKFKREVTKSFNKKINMTLICNVFLYIIIKDIIKLSVPMSILTCISIYILMTYFVLRIVYKKVNEEKERYFMNTNIKEKIKEIKEEDEILSKQKVVIIKKFKVLFGICISISILSFLYTAINYGNLPNTIITHWSSRGIPQIYEQKNLLDVFYMNLLDLVIVALLSLISVANLSSTKYIDYGDIEENRRKALKYLNRLGYSLFILTLSIELLTTIIPIFLVQQISTPIWIVLVVLIVSMFIEVLLMHSHIMLNSTKPRKKSFYTVQNDDEKWLYGFLYYNKEDPSLIVEKRLGTGASINMANKLGKIITATIAMTTFSSLAVLFI